MAARERPTASYASIPFATVSDKASLATQRRIAAQEIDLQPELVVAEQLIDDPGRWAHATATDLVGECVRVRSSLPVADRDDPASRGN